MTADSVLPEQRVIDAVIGHSTGQSMNCKEEEEHDSLLLAVTPLRANQV